MASSAADRVRELEREALPGRLLRGAEVLGRLWRDGERCRDSWAARCSCGTLASHFCEAKTRWAGIFLEWYGGVWPRHLTGEGKWDLVEAMRYTDPRWWEATGLTALVEVPGGRVPIRVGGARGTDWKTIEDLDAIPAGPGRDEAIRAVETIQKVTV